METLLWTRSASHLGNQVVLRHGWLLLPVLLFVTCGSLVPGAALTQTDNVVMAFLEIAELTGMLGLNDADLSWKRPVKICQICKHVSSVDMS